MHLSDTKAQIGDRLGGLFDEFDFRVDLNLRYLCRPLLASGLLPLMKLRACFGCVGAGTLPMGNALAGNFGSTMTLNSQKDCIQFVCDALGSGYCLDD